jgi:HSP20 family protein
MATIIKNPNRQLSTLGLLDSFDLFWPTNFLEEKRLVTLPSINIKVEKNAYILELAAPGLKKEDFKIALDGNYITISCEKEDKQEESEANKYSRTEYNYSSFTRTFTLPEDSDSEKITASYKDGILNLKVARKATSNGKEVNKIITIE